ncbi:MAG: cysteine-rich KTR domain-containing protein [Clostridiales bacterium]|nr:cysteine-rich KTR domain-containing protein [Clostridiales bacterium]
MQNKKTDCKFILCPVCGNKTHTMIREDTELKNFPLYCPKCKKETIINVRDMEITLAHSSICCERVVYLGFIAIEATV